MMKQKWWGLTLEVKSVSGDWVIIPPGSYIQLNADNEGVMPPLFLTKKAAIQHIKKRCKTERNKTRYRPTKVIVQTE